MRSENEKSEMKKFVYVVDVQTRIMLVGTNKKHSKERGRTKFICLQCMFAFQGAVEGENENCSFSFAHSSCFSSPHQKKIHFFFSFYRS
jgi:hypothetical protein